MTLSYIEIAEYYISLELFQINMHLPQEKQYIVKSSEMMIAYINIIIFNTMTDNILAHFLLGIHHGPWEQLSLGHIMGFTTRYLVVPASW